MSWLLVEVDDLFDVSLVINLFDEVDDDDLLNVCVILL
jgi:hypothetical protein